MLDVLTVRAKKVVQTSTVIDMAGAGVLHRPVLHRSTDISGLITVILLSRSAEGERREILSLMCYAHEVLELHTHAPHLTST